MESGRLESLLEAFLCGDDRFIHNTTTDFNTSRQHFGNLSLLNTNHLQPPKRLCNANLRNLTTDLENDVFKDVLTKLNIYATPLLILVGVLGNVISFLVFTTTHLKRQSSSVYLASLAVVDTLFLMVLTVVWLSWIQVPLFHKEGWCQLTIYLIYISNFLSAYIVVAFTIERYIVVSHPFKRDRLCTTARATKCVGGLFLISVVVYSTSTWTNGVQELPHVEVCMPLPQYYKLLTVFTMFDFVVTLIIPSVLIVGLNIRIAYQIIRLSKTREGLEQVTVLHSRLRSDCSNSKDIGPVGKNQNDFIYSWYANKEHSAPRGGANSLDHDKSSVGKPVTHNSMRISHRRMRAQHRTARMLIIVSSVFVVLNVPGHAFSIHAFIETSRQDVFATERQTLRWQELFLLLYHLNFAINFLLYSLSGSAFRKALRSFYHRSLHWILKFL